jgi:hypothetical protein
VVAVEMPAAVQVTVAAVVQVDTFPLSQVKILEAERQQRMYPQFLWGLTQSVLGVVALS